MVGIVVFPRRSVDLSHFCGLGLGGLHLHSWLAGSRHRSDGHPSPLFILGNLLSGVAVPLVAPRGGVDIAALSLVGNSSSVRRGFIPLGAAGPRGRATGALDRWASRGGSSIPNHFAAVNPVGLVHDCGG